MPVEQWEIPAFALFKKHRQKLVVREPPAVESPSRERVSRASAGQLQRGFRSSLLAYRVKNDSPVQDVHHRKHQADGSIWSGSGRRGLYGAGLDEEGRLR